MTKEIYHLNETNSLFWSLLRAQSTVELSDA